MSYKIGLDTFPDHLVRERSAEKSATGTTPALRNFRPMLYASECWQGAVRVNIWRRRKSSQMSRRKEGQFPATISLKESRDKGPVTLWLRQSDLEGLNEVRNANGMMMPSATVAYHLFLIGMRCVKEGLRRYQGNGKRLPVVQFTFDLKAGE